MTEDTHRPQDSAERTGLTGLTGHTVLTGWKLLISTVVLIGIWALVIQALGSVAIPGAWSRHGLAVIAISYVSACLAKLALGQARALGPMIGIAAGGAYGLWWFISTEEKYHWEPSVVEVLRELVTHIRVSNPPLEAVGPLDTLLIGFLWILSAIPLVALIWFNRPIVAGALSTLFLLIPTAVLSRPTLEIIGIGPLILLGLAILFLIWLSSPHPNVLGAASGGLALVVASGLLVAAPSTQDRVWNMGIAYAPVSGSIPDVTIALAQDLRERSNTRAFNFTSPSPGTFRFTLATLRDFNGGSWQPSQELSNGEVTVSTPRTAAGLPPALLSPSPVSPQTSVLIEVEGLRSTWLPLPQSSFGVLPAGADNDFDSEQWVWLADANSALTSSSGTDRGDKYFADATQLLSHQLVDSGFDVPSWDALSPFTDPALAPEVLQPYLALPDDLPPELAAITADLAHGAHDRFSIAQSLEDWLRSPAFSYDESAPYEPGADPDDPYAVMRAFLDLRSGYCVHFAATFAVLARSMGVPTRLAIGYAARANLAGQENVVRGRNLHAWPEIYVDGVGWIAFEPTPGGAGVLADETEVDEPSLPEPTVDPLDPNPSEPSPSEPSAIEPPTVEMEGDDDGAAAGDPSQLSVLLGAVLQVAPWVLLAILVAAIPAFIRYLRRWRRLYLVRRARDAALNLWQEVCDVVIDHAATTSLPTARAHTPEAYGEQLLAAGIVPEEAGPALKVLIAGLNEGLYGPPTPQAAELDVAELFQAYNAVDKSIRFAHPWQVRWRARLLPLSLLPRTWVVRKTGQTPRAN